MTFEEAMAARALLFEEAIGSGIRVEVAREDAAARAAANLLKESNGPS